MALFASGRESRAMAIQYWWWLVAIALGIAEMFTGSFYLLVLAAGAAGAGLAAALGSAPPASSSARRSSAPSGAALVRRLRPLGSTTCRPHATRDVNLDIGQVVQVRAMGCQPPLARRLPRRDVGRGAAAGRAGGARAAS